MTKYKLIALTDIGGNVMDKKSMLDAPKDENSTEASAWARGYNQAIYEMQSHQKQGEFIPMQGTISINNVMHDTTPPYGCHSERAPNRLSQPMVRHGNGQEGNAEWPFVMSTVCNYDRRESDTRCASCSHP